MRHAVLAQTRMELLLTVRRAESLLVTFLIPIGLLVFFAKVDTVRSDTSIDFLVPGILALSVMSTAMVSLGIATGYERRYLVLKRLGATPLSRGALITAKIGNVLVIESVQVVVIVVAGLMLGWSPTGAGVAAIGLLLIGTVAFAGVGLLMAGTLAAEVNLALANGLFLVLLFLGDMAYPLDRLPRPLQLLGEALPAAALADSVRAVTTGAAAPVGAVIVLGVWTVAAPLAAARWFRWEE